MAGEIAKEAKPVLQRARGTQDILPLEQPVWHTMRHSAERLSISHGYQRIDTPIFEPTALFTRSAGETSDVVTKEMYTFTDRAGRSITLRPEGTAPVVRAYFEGALDNERQPVRLFYLGPFFRYDRPQAGRFRQFHQYGIEAIGSNDPSLDVEVIMIAWRWFEELGISGLSLQLNSIGDAVCRPTYRQALRDYYRPHLDQLCPEDRVRFEQNPLRLLDCKNPQCSPLQADAPRTVDYLCEACQTAFSAVTGGLERAGIPFTINPRLVRGLDYYTRTVFELWHESLGGAQNSLGGGGRYDGLAEELGYRSTPAIGFALGLERTASILKQNRPGPDVVVMALSGVDEQQLASLARRLYDRGLSVVVDRSPAKLDAKLRSAAKHLARTCAIYGPEEASRGEAVVRDMDRKSQRSVPLESVPEAILQDLAG